MKTYKQILSESIMSDESNVKVKMNAAAGVIVRLNEDGTKQVLLIQRAPDDHWPHHWEFPRGKCDHGKLEDTTICVKREIKEETGLDIQVIGLIDKFEYLADGGTRLTTCYNYLCKMDPPNQKIKLSKEHQDYKWVSEIGQAALLVLPDQKRTIEKVLNNDRPILSQPNNGLSNNNRVEEGGMLEKYLFELNSKKIAKKYNAYDGVIDQKTFKNLMMIVKGIRVFMEMRFKKLKPKFYTYGLPEVEMDYYRESLVLSNVFTMEWNLWGTDQSDAPACDELMKIQKEIFISTMKKFKMVPGNAFNKDVSDNILMLKGGKVIMSMGGEGDKCEDFQCSINIYGSNVESYEMENLEKYGIR